MRKPSLRPRLLAGGLAVLLAGTLGLATPAAQGATAGSKVRVLGSRDVPFGTIVWTGKIAMITESGTNGDLYFWWNRGGDTGWHEEVVAKASTSVQFSDPSVAWTGTYDTGNPSVVITASGDSPGLSGHGHLYYFWQAFGTKAWHHQVMAKGFYHDPSIAVTSTSVAIAAVNGTGTSLYYWYQPFQTTRWHEQVLARHSAYLTASIGWTGSTVVLATLNAVQGAQQGNIVYWWNRGGDTAWHRQTVPANGINEGPGTPSLAVVKNLVVIAATGDFHIYFWYQRFGTPTWHQQMVATSAAGFADPSIASAGNKISIVAPGQTGGLWDFYQHYGTRPWHRQTLTPSGFFYIQGASITGTHNATVIAALNNSKNPADVEAFSQAYGTTPWNEQTIASGCC